jgi:hypothetical protein
MPRITENLGCVKQTKDDNEEKGKEHDLALI